MFLCWPVCCLIAVVGFSCNFNSRYDFIWFHLALWKCARKPTFHTQSSCSRKCNNSTKREHAVMRVKAKRLRSVISDCVCYNRYKIKYILILNEVFLFWQPSKARIFYEYTKIALRCIENLELTRESIYYNSTWLITELTLYLYKNLSKKKKNRCPFELLDNDQNIAKFCTFHSPLLKISSLYGQNRQYM